MTLLSEFQQTQLPASYANLDPATLTQHIQAAKAQLGSKLLLLAHHYQKDEIVAQADFVGDSLQLAQLAAKNHQADYIVFCGVHFMAETADMLTAADQQVILPDLNAGCSMADMANMYQVTAAWQAIQARYPDEVMPVTYVNSSAAVKAFVGEHGGVIVTSGNAEKVLQWAFTQKQRLFFLPDQHLGRNTAYQLGVPLEQMVLWDPTQGQFKGRADQATRIILWEGWCAVHQQFNVAQIKALRAQDPAIKIIVHPECAYEVVQAADVVGSTHKIMTTVQQSPQATHWAVGTDHNLVQRMQATLPQKIDFINPIACACMTMNRIKLPHLAWCLDQLVAGQVPNQIKVDPETTEKSLSALQRMLMLS